MAEEILIAELRAGVSKFEADLRKARESSDRQSREIANALDKVDSAVKGLPGEFKKLSREMEQTERQSRQMNQATQGLNRSFISLKNVVAGIGLAAFAASMLKLSKDGIAASQSLQSVNLQLTNLTGSASAAAKEMEFIRQETDRLSQNTIVGAQGFARLANAAKGTAIEGEGVRQVFSALSELAVANRLSSEQLGNVLNQVTQILSKQRIQTEELVTLSENGIPAFRLLAEAIGITGAQLSDSLSKGKVPFETILLLIQKVRDEFGGLASDAANTVPAQFQRLINSIRLGLADFFDAILSSQELLKAAKDIFGGISTEDIFPSRNSIIAKVDEIVKVARGYFELIQTLATVTKNFIAATFDALGNIIAGVLNFARQAFATLSQTFRTGAEKLSFGLLFKGASEEAIAEVDKIQFSLSEKLKTLFTPITDSTELQAVNITLKSIFGIEDKPLLDKEETGEAAQGAANEVSSKYQKMLDDLKRVAKQQITDALTPDQKKVEAEAKKAADRIIKIQVEAQAELRKLIFENDARIAREAQAALDLELESARTGKSVLPPLEQNEETKKRIDEYGKIFDTLREDIQHTLGSVIADAFKGQITSIKDIAKSIQNVFADLAGNIFAAFTVKPLTDALLGDLDKFAESGDLGGLVGKIGDKLGISGAQLGKVIGGAGLGVTAGFGASGLLGGGTLGNVLGGALGGGLAGGALAGTFVLPGIGTALGAGIGAAVGGLGGGIASLFGGDDNRARIGLQTTAGLPDLSAIEDRVVQRTAFGIISLIDKISENIGAGDVTTVIAEIDASIARLLDDRQEALVARALQSAPTIQFQQEKVDDAIAKVIQDRLFVILSTIAGTSVATTVVGQQGTASASNIDAIQKRVQDALEIFKLLDEFRGGPLTGVAQAIKAINDQFDELIDRANSLGLSQQAAELAAEQQRQIGQITVDFNQDVANQILQITNPIAAEWANLEKIQKDRLDNARDAGADLLAVEKLNALERNKLQQDINIREAARHKEVEKASIDAGESIKENLIKRMKDFAAGTLSNFGQQIRSLESTFQELKTEARESGLGVSEITKAFKQQRAELQRAAQESIASATLSISNPFKAAMLQISQQVREFQKLASEGLISQRQVSLFRELATEQARFQQALSIAGGGNKSPEQQLIALRDAFIESTKEVSPLEQQIRDLTEEAKNLKSALGFAGVPSQGIFESLSAAVGALQNAEKGRVQSLINAFLTSTRSGLRQELSQLGLQFGEILDAASPLRLVTKELTDAYFEQQRAIRVSHINAFNDAFNGLIDTYVISIRQVNEQVAEFQKLVDDRFLSQRTVDSFKQLALATAAIQEATSRASGAAKSPVTQVAEAFEAFVGAGNPLTQTGQQLFNLTENFLNLVDAAKLLGFSTKDLEESYLNQANAIREQAITAIDASLEPRRQGLQNITDFLSQLRLGQELPSNLRIDEARAQFQAAAAGGNINEALRIAEEFRQIARERFGGTSGFFDVRNEIINVLSTLRERERQSIEEERNRLIRQEDNQIQQLQLTRNSVDYLQRISSSNNDTARGIESLITIARGQEQLGTDTLNMLRRLVNQIGG